jgi:hypothetical protein
LKLPDALQIVLTLNSDDELPAVAWNGLNSRVEAERPFFRESESGKKPDQLFRLLIVSQSNTLGTHSWGFETKFLNTRTSTKLNASLTRTMERQQNHSLVAVFSMVMPNVARRHTSSRMICCMLIITLCAT